MYCIPASSRVSQDEDGGDFTFHEDETEKETFRKASLRPPARFYNPCAAKSAHAFKALWMGGFWRQ